MLSDESSSDSETGRFKGRTKTEEEQNKSSNKKEDNFRSAGRSRPSENDRFRREFDKRRDDRNNLDRYSRDRPRFSRHSPIRRRHSKDRSPIRSHERHRHGRDSRGGSKHRDIRSSSRDKYKESRARSHHKSPDRRRDHRKEIKRNISPKERSTEKFDRRPREKKSSSPEYKNKKSEVYVAPAEPRKKKSESPIIVEEHGDTDISEEVQPASYYSLIPVVAKEKSEESSEIDSSDDERLRAKLLNLEKELQKTRKKKHKKKHKRKKSKERDDAPVSVEVSSTTDIQEVKSDEPSTRESVEVTSTQKSAQKESSEEGEISSDDDSQNQINIDPSDLRHKLKKSIHRDESRDQRSEVCGPALPPHLQKQFGKNASPEIEGPSLPPHLEKRNRHIGPAINDDLRKTLAERDREVVKYESSDEDVGIGPLPTGSDKMTKAHQQLEERALDMKIKKLDGHSLQNSNVKSREQWMLELPDAKAKILGLEARSFRAKEGPDMSDRSSWTDTPEEKARKAAGLPTEEDAEVALQREARARHIANRDKEQELAVKKHKKKHKRDESLLEMHEKKLKKKKKKEEKEDGKKERRPFSRDIDLQVNRFDDAQKKSIIKKAQNLDSRFSSGEAKYL